MLESGERKEVGVARKRFTPEQIIGMLREVEVRVSHGEKVKRLYGQTFIIMISDAWIGLQNGIQDQIHIDFFS